MCTSNGCPYYSWLLKSHLHVEQRVCDCTESVSGHSAAHSAAFQNNIYNHIHDHGKAKSSILTLQMINVTSIWDKVLKVICVCICVYCLAVNSGHLIFVIFFSSMTASNKYKITGLFRHMLTLWESTLCCEVLQLDSNYPFLLSYSWQRYDQIAMHFPCYLMRKSSVCSTSRPQRNNLRLLRVTSCLLISSVHPQV